MNLTIFGILLVLLVLLSIWKRMHVRTAQLQFKYQLYTLRDKLRSDAITGVIEPDSWLFDYYDRTLSKLVANSYGLTLFGIILIESRHRSDVKLQNFKRELRYRTSKNKYYKTLDEEITKCAAIYAFDQHRISLMVIVMPIVTPIKVCRMVS